MMFYFGWDWKEFGFGINFSNTFHKIIIINVAFLYLQITWDQNEN
jgi:hypothetical protein